LSGLLNTSFLQLNSFHENISYDLLLSKKGRASLIKHRQVSVSTRLMHTTGQKAIYLKKARSYSPSLIWDLYKGGKVVRSMYDKYRQINRFVELIDDAVKTSEARNGRW
jgi:hypothetical protein